MNKLDQLIHYVAPERALKRLLARQKVTQWRHYDAASTGRRTEQWSTPAGSPRAETSVSLPLLRNRSRDLVRNNPYAERAVRSLVANLIGPGIIPQAKGVSLKRRRHVEQQWRYWGERLCCDVDQRYNFYGLQSLIVREMIEAGECLVRLIKRQTPQGLPIQLQVLEPDFIDTTKNSDTFANKNKHVIHHGIEFNAQGERVAYWLFNQHPQGGIHHTLDLTSSRVPADEIIHLYRVDRAGQLRGVPWGAPIIIKLKDLDDYDQAELVRHKTTACFAGFIRETDVEGLPQRHPSVIRDKLEPGILEILPAGKDITFSKPPESHHYSDYVNAHLRAIAIGFGMPYEVLTGDYSQVNFSSGRMGWLEFQRHIHQWQSQLIIPLLCQRVWHWFIQALQITGQLAHISDDLSHANWTPPRREMIDPLKEVKALRDQVRCGFMTLSEAIRVFGYDPEEQYAKLHEDANRLDQLNLTVDSDPRRDSAADVSNADRI